MLAIWHILDEYQSIRKEQDAQAEVTPEQPLMFGHQQKFCENLFLVKLESCQGTKCFLIRLTKSQEKSTEVI